ncbi:hypothetical protein [Pedobacter sp. NJ-S-72]
MEQPAAALNLNIDISQKIDRFALIVIDRWHQALKQYNIGVTGALMNSFIKEIKKNNGDVEAVIFKFLKYGRFDDMGVGKGVSLNDRVLNRKFDKYRNTSGKTVGSLGRKKKPWYTKTFYREVANFKAFYQKKYMGIS